MISPSNHCPAGPFELTIVKHLVIIEIAMKLKGIDKLWKSTIIGKS